MTLKMLQNLACCMQLKQVFKNVTACKIHPSTMGAWGCTCSYLSLFSTKMPFISYTFFGCFYCFYVVTVSFCNSVLLTMYMYTFFLHRAVQLHQKLSSPLRKRSLAESIKISAEKQNKAQQFRDKLNEERVQRSRVISDKVCISI